MWRTRATCVPPVLACWLQIPQEYKLWRHSMTTDSRGPGPNLMVCLVCIIDSRDAKTWRALQPFQPSNFSHVYVVSFVRVLLHLASSRKCILLLDRLDTLPSAAQPLLPQADPIVASADREHVTAQTPAHAPGHGIDVEHGGFPVICDMLALDLHLLHFQHT